MANHDPFLHEKQRDCERLFRKYKGKSHELIEYEMRQLGWTTFHRRCLYPRGSKPGWIKALNWDQLNKLPSLAKEGWPGLPVGIVRPTQYPASGTQAIPSAHSPLPTAHIASVERFRTWLLLNWPNMDWDAKHLQLVCDKLEQVSRGECPRLIIQMPPRHGKSELVTVRYPAFRLRRDPSENIIIASYGQKLANRFSRKIRRALADDFANQRRSGSPPCEGGVAAGSGTKNDASAKAAADGVVLSAAVETSSELSERGTLAGSDVEDASPFPFINTRPKNSEAEWETSKGGGLRAVGVGGGVTGFGANLIVVDDPIKSRAEAESPTARERVWEWFNDDIYTRLEPNGAIIVVQTRWHEDDLAGRLIRQMEEGGEHWDVISLPAIAESDPGNAGSLACKRPTDADDVVADATPEIFAPHALIVRKGGLPPLQDPPQPTAGVNPPSGLSDVTGNIPGKIEWRQPGEALWPSRYPIARLETIRKQIGTYSFEGLFQQRPIPADGGMFKREWFRKIIAAPPPNLRWTRGYDLGVTATPGSDHTASFRVAFDRDGNLYIDGGFRARIEYPAQRRYILGRIAAERDTEHGVEATHNGVAIVQDLRRERGTFGRSLRPIKVNEPKTARAIPWIALAESGCVYLVRGGWNQDFIDEACSFPTGTFDDQIDAVSLAVKMQRRRENGFHTFA